MTVSDETKIAELKKDIGYIKDAIDEMKAELKSLTNSFVTKAEFEPIKKVVYGMITVVLIGVFGAIVGLVVK